jgi:hypothetical protein
VARGEKGGGRGSKKETERGSGGGGDGSDQSPCVTHL